jgi:hypothetical protein
MDLTKIKEASTREAARSANDYGPGDVEEHGDIVLLLDSVPGMIAEIERLTGALRHIQFAERSEDITQIVVATIGPAEGDPS